MRRVPSYEACRAYKDLEHFETPYVVKLHRWGGPGRLRA